MSDNDSIWAAVARAVQLFFYPVQEASRQGEAGIMALVEDALGTDNPTSKSAVTGLADAVRSFAGDLSGVSSPADITTATATLLDALETASDALASDAASFLEYLTVQFLWNIDPRAYGMLALLGVIDEAQQPGDRLVWGNLQYLAHPGK